MAYVEKIKVGNGETWPIRDAEAHAKIDSVSSILADIPEKPVTVGEWDGWKCRLFDTNRYEATYIIDPSTETTECTQAFGSIYISPNIIQIPLPPMNASLDHYSGSASLMSEFSSAFIYREDNNICVRFWCPTQVADSYYRISLRVEGTY